MHRNIYASSACGFVIRSERANVRLRRATVPVGVKIFHRSSCHKCLVFGIFLSDRRLRPARTIVAIVGFSTVPSKYLNKSRSVWNQFELFSQNCSPSFRNAKNDRLNERQPIEFSKGKAAVPNGHGFQLCHRGLDLDTREMEESK